MEEKDDNKKDSSYGVFTEDQRKAVRQKLLGLAKQQAQDLPTEKEVAEQTKRQKDSNIPLLVDQEFHTSFTMASYRAELDEVPYLFLFRTYFMPYLVNNTSIELENLRFLTEVVGMQGTMLEENIKGLTLSGEMLRGGPIKFISFQLARTRGATGTVTIKNIIFYTKKEKT